MGFCKNPAKIGKPFQLQKNFKFIAAVSCFSLYQCRKENGKDAAITILLCMKESNQNLKGEDYMKTKEEGKKNARSTERIARKYG